MSSYADCYRCGEPGHWQATCPLISQAASEAEHLSRIRLYVDRWVDGHMTLEQKRVSISLENALWHGEKVPGHLTYP